MGSTPLSFREQEIVLKAKLRDQLTLRDGKWLWAIKLDGTSVHVAHYMDGGRPSWSFNPYRTVTEARESFEELIVEALRRGYLPLAEAPARPAPVSASDPRGAAPPPATEASLLAGARTPIERGLLEEALSAGRTVLASGQWAHELSVQGTTVRRAFGKRGEHLPASVDGHPSFDAARLAFARAVLAALHQGYRPPAPAPWTAGATARPAQAAPAASSWQTSVAGLRGAHPSALGAEVRQVGRTTTVTVRPARMATSLDRALGELHHLAGERLTLELQAGIDPASAVEGLRSSGLPDRVRGLCLCAFDQPASFEAAFLDVEPLAQLLGGVEELTLQAGGLRLGALQLPRLRELSVRARGLSVPVLAQLAALELPALERLTLWFGAERHGADVQADDVLELLREAPLPRLRHLALQNAEFADDLCAHLGKVPQLPQLETLDLSFGALTTAGARRLVDLEARLRHLKLLRADHCTLSVSGRAELERLGGYVEAKGQHTGRVEQFVPLRDEGGFDYLP